MIVHAPLAFVFRWLGEVTKVDSATRGDVVEMRYLESAHALRIGVVEDPLVVPQVGEVAAVVEHAMPNLGDDAAVLVFKEEVAPLLIPEPVFRLREDVLGIPPDEVGGVTIRNDDAQIAAVHVRRDEPREVAAFRLRPAVEQDEAFPIRSHEQMIGVMLRVSVVLHDHAGL